MTMPCVARRSRRAAREGRACAARRRQVLEVFLADGSAPKWAHDAKSLERVALRSGGDIDGMAFDTMLAGYLLDPASADYPLRTLADYLGADVLGAAESEEADRGPAVRRYVVAHGAAKARPRSRCSHR